MCPHCDDASVAFADQPTLRRHEREVHKVFRYKCAQMRSILTHAKDPASLRIAKKDGTVVAANDDDVKTLSYNTVETAVEEKEMEIDEAELTSPTGRTRRRAAVRCVITEKKLQLLKIPAFQNVWFYLLFQNSQRFSCIEHQRFSLTSRKATSQYLASLMLRLMTQPMMGRTISR